VLTQIYKEYGVILQKIFSELENLISNNAERFLHKVLGISKLKYCRQVLASALTPDAYLLS